MKVLLPLTLSVLSGMACAANRDFNRDGKFLVENAETPYPSRKFRMPGGYETVKKAWTQVTDGLAKQGYEIQGYLTGSRGNSKNVFECTKEGDSSTQYVAKISFDWLGHEKEIIRFLLPCRNCDLGRWLDHELETRKIQMEAITDRNNPEYKAKLAKQCHSCDNVMCQNGRIRNPQLHNIILPTEVYFKTYVHHNDPAISHRINPLPILCEVQRKIRCFKDDGTQNKADVALYESLQARTKKAGLSHGDDGIRQCGVPSGESDAVYVDLEMTFIKAPKRSRSASGRTKISLSQRLAHAESSSSDGMPGMTGSIAPSTLPAQNDDRMPGHTAPATSTKPFYYNNAGMPGSSIRQNGETLEQKTSDGDGVRIQNAEIPELNGWYMKRESTAWPANARAGTLSQWQQWNGDRQWYQKDDDCYIVWYDLSATDCGWFLRDANGDSRYVKFCGRESLPEGQQWKFQNSADAEALGVAKPRYGRAASSLVARTS